MRLSISSHWSNIAWSMLTRHKPEYCYSKDCKNGYANSPLVFAGIRKFNSVRLSNIEDGSQKDLFNTGASTPAGT